jgi:hypothetical protein
MPSRALFALAVIPLCFVPLACGGGQKWSMDASWSTDQQESKGGRVSRDLNPQATAEVDAGVLGWIGVRHDLLLSPAVPHTEICSCLAVAVGGLGDKRFAWQNGAPPNENELMAVAISTHGTKCPGGPTDENQRRPSISAVDRDGADVIIEVEELPPSRPLATGAVFLRPGPTGGVYVRSRNNRLPYARPVGDRLCRVLTPAQNPPVSAGF